MAAFHDEVFSEINSARKLVAEFKRRHDASADANQEDDAALETPCEEEFALADEYAVAGAQESELTDSQSEASEILRDLAEARARERAAAEESVRKALEKLGASSGADPERRETTPADPVRYFWFPGLGASHVWYFTAERERCGPVTFKDLRTMAASGVLDPRLDMVWKKGMSEWKQAGLVDGLFERQIIQEEEDKTPPRATPVKSLRSSTLIKKLASKNLHWPGVGRGVLICGVFLFPVLWNDLHSLSSPFLVSKLGTRLMEILHPILTIVPPLVLIGLILNRLTNVGMNRWWSLTVVVPLLNLWIAFRCLFCPPGYAYHRKMDRSGVIMIAVFCLIAPFTWQAIPSHPVATYSAYLQTGVRAVFERAGKIANLWL